ncbi:long-chain fatty acid--CoA ligase [Lapillicoccus sp.]|uniref:long-chain-fatty-acid--CoA ligase n=1 Tax=Lapillicoccus sp. TaxID=1909287 RepID=UPI0025DFFBBE|nr:long-chain fatty acid--CoA ligase [Lapillicoccus sp.]
MAFNIAYLVREAAKQHSDKAALLFDGGSLTFAQVDALSDQMAAGLRAEGFGPGDKIGLQLPNLPQFVIAYFAILKAGCVVVPMNVLLTTPEVAFQLGDSQAKALITWAGTAEHAARAVSAAGVKHLYVVNTPGTPTAGVGEPMETLYAAADPNVPAPMEQCDPGDTAVVIYTSGTTGTPKGAELTHFQLLMNAETPGRLFGVRSDDIVLVVLPLFHVFGLCSHLNLCMRFGATMSLQPRFEPEKILEVMRRDRVTVFEGVPTMFIALLHQADIGKDDITTLRVGVCGGASLPAKVLDAFEAKFGITILEGYGLTETAATTTFNVSSADRRIYSVGKPIWGVDVQIWGEGERVLPPGKDQVGEVVIRGVNVMKGYFNNPEATAAAFTRGWMRTGDLGYFDDDGYLFIVDRKKDLIIRGGYNVYPSEVEESLYAHPGVQEAAVIGIPDDRLGEEVKAFIIPREGITLTAEEIVDFLKERVAAYKYPRVIEFRSELAHGPTGKILKGELR